MIRFKIDIESVPYPGYSLTSRHPNMRLEYIVVGRGQFPRDMLRYDEASVDPDDVELMDSRERRALSITGRRCTPARWESFGWRVHELEKVLP